jgi:hypothetical protein
MRLLGFPKQSDAAFQIDRVPQRDGGDHYVETAGAILLILEGTVADLAQPMKNTALARAFLASPDPSLVSYSLTPTKI